MEDNKERIYICGFKEKPCKTCEPFYDCMTCSKKDNYDMSMSKQEAIEIMAKALYEEDNLLALDNIKFEELGASKQMAYKNYAVAILNALLGEQGNETD